VRRVSKRFGVVALDCFARQARARARIAAHVRFAGSRASRAIVRVQLCDDAFGDRRRDTVVIHRRRERFRFEFIAPGDARRDARARDARTRRANIHRARSNFCATNLRAAPNLCTCADQSGRSDETGNRARRACRETARSNASRRADFCTGGWLNYARRGGDDYAIARQSKSRGIANACRARLFDRTGYDHDCADPGSANRDACAIADRNRDQRAERDSIAHAGCRSARTTNTRAATACARSNIATA